MKRAPNADFRRFHTQLLPRAGRKDDFVNATCDNLCKIEKLGGVEAPGCALIPKDPEVT